MNKKNNAIKIIHGFLIGEKSGKQFFRYLVTGISSFLLEYILFFLLFSLAGINSLIANPLAITVAFWFNFLMNKYWSFESKGEIGRQLILYLALFAFNTLFSNLFIYGGTVLFGLSPLISKVAAMCIIVIWNFAIYRKLIYRKRQED